MVVDVSIKLGTSKKGAHGLGRSCTSIAVLDHAMVCVEGSGKTLHTWSVQDLSQSSHSLDSLAPGASIDSEAQISITVPTCRNEICVRAATAGSSMW